MLLEDVVFAVRDPRGRLVVLTRPRLEHIRSEHTEMSELLPELLRAIQDPTDVRAGWASDEEWYYLASAGPSAWIKVVVAFDRRGTGRIITAFPRRAKP